MSLKLDRWFCSVEVQLFIIASRKLVPQCGDGVGYDGDGYGNGKDIWGWG